MEGMELGCLSAFRHIYPFCPDKGSLILVMVRSSWKVAASLHYLDVSPFSDVRI
jgi:hypothetical protein